MEIGPLRYTDLDTHLAWRRVFQFLDGQLIHSPIACNCYNQMSANPFHFKICVYLLQDDVTKLSTQNENVYETNSYHKSEQKDIAGTSKMPYAS